jgi:hypothetical protein
LSATGGTAPYTWTVASGSLPGGLTLSGAGIISGTPTQAGNSSFTVRVTDQLGGTATRALSISVSSVGEGFLVLSGMPAIVNPTSQAPITLSLRSPSGASLSGTLTLSFAPNAIVPGDDAVVAFSNGSRSVRFNIAANTTNASFPTQTLLLTGTVAGTISFNASIDGSPGTVAVGSILIQPVTPHLSDVRATRAPGSLRVEVSGYSAERRVSTVEFTFDVRVNGQIEKVVLTRNVEAEFDAWYRSAAANPFGSAFLFAQTFNVDGDVNIVESVTVRLANGQGIGGSQPATFGN